MNNSLDLHKVRHGDVPRVLDEFLGPHLMGKTSNVEIITGKSDRMKSVVADTLKDYSLEYEEVWGNPGVVTVKL